MPSKTRGVSVLHATKYTTLNAPLHGVVKNRFETLMYYCIIAKGILY